MADRVIRVWVSYEADMVDVGQCYHPDDVPALLRGIANVWEFPEENEDDGAADVQP